MNKQLRFTFASVLCLAFLVSLTASPAFADSSSSSKKKKLAKLIKAKGLKATPSVTKAIAKKKSSSKASGMNVSASASSTPTIVEIADSESPEQYFWEKGTLDNIIASTASQSECESFWDGVGACQMVSNVGYSFGQIAQADTSLCYMKNFPTQKNLAAGGISLVSGTLPDNNVAKIFIPGNTSRTVEVRVSGFKEDGEGAQEEGGGGEENIFLQIPSITELKNAGNSYSASIYFCRDSSAAGYNTIEITNGGRFTVVQADQRDEEGGSSLFKSEVSGYLTVSSNEKSIEWDTSKTRKATSSFKQLSDNPMTFKSEISVANTLLTSKEVNTFGDGEIHKGYNLSRILGSGFSNVALSSGAFSGLGNFGTYLASTKFDTSSGVYNSDSQGELFNKASSFDFSADAFYDGSADPTIDTSEFDCSKTADIVVSLDMSNSTVQDSVKNCEPTRRDFNFCWGNSKVQAAQQNFDIACHSSQP